jgi:integrase
MAAIHRLSARRVETLHKPGRYADGDGLFLSVKSPTSRSWLFRFRWAGKDKNRHGDHRHCEIGLGPVRDVSLKEARDMVAEMRNQIAKGIKPISPRHRARIDAINGMTFRECAERFIAQHEKTGAWANEKHRQQWKNTLTTYAYPTFGDVPIEAVDKGMIVKALDAIWTEKPETASRVRGRVKNILDWAIDRGYRTAVNPTPTPKGMGPQPDNGRHMPALPWEQIPEFMADLRRQEGVAARALEFAILCASRSGEVRLMRWSSNEIDLLTKQWTCPAERMKGKKKDKRDHIVPLTDRCVEIITHMRDRAFNDWVFPGERADRPLSDMTLTAVMRRMSDVREEAGLPRWIDPNEGGADVVPHGFRSTFKDYATEQLPFPNEVSEAALAHVKGDKVEAAYKRDSLLSKRRKLMEAWSRYCAKPARSGAVLDFEMAKQ